MDRGVAKGVWGVGGEGVRGKWGGVDRGVVKGVWGVGGEGVREEVGRSGQMSSEGSVRCGRGGGEEGK